mmetsp:Transcript_94755/g.245231  ORF Transcript_94755/g.245231 Transcript_94755/m.245231 type:complete len:1038 (-) Transcript_94755:115-3228(-)
MPEGEEEEAHGEDGGIAGGRSYLPSSLLPTTTWTKPFAVAASGPLGAASLRFEGDAPVKKGRYGGLAPTGELVDALRSAKKQRAQETQVAGVNDQDIIPVSAYSSICPLEYCCGISMNGGPCSENKMAQAAFGNLADLATLDNRRKDHVIDQHITIGTMLGLPPYDEQGYELVVEPRALRSLHNDDEREHFVIAGQTFGLQYVHKQGDEANRVMVSYRKNEVPGSEMEVKERIKKLLAIDHINVAKLLQVCEDDEEFYLIYEAQDGMGYLPCQVLSRGVTLTASEGAKLIQQMAAAAAACHRAGIYHLDWSIWNVMSMTYGSLFPMKVFGFGLAGCLHSGKSSNVHEGMWEARGAFFYMSPEVCRIRCDPDISQPYRKLDPTLKGPADVWGLGAVAYVSISGHPAYGGLTEVQVMRNCIEKKPSFDNGFSHIERLGMDLIEGLLQKDPKMRPRSESVISNGWVVQHVRAVEDKTKVGKVIDRMREYSQLKPAMRTLGRVLRQSLRIDKLRQMESLFHALDIRGDGELEPHELGAYFVDKTGELKQMFKVMDLNSSVGISLEEFVLANIFGQEILTERMLLRTFEFLDLDGTGEITAVELYSALKKFEPSLTPTDVGELMGSADRDWDADIDFEEFRGFFPNVQSNSHAFQARLQKSKQLQEVSERTYEEFKAGCVQWMSDVAEEKDRAVKVRKVAEKDDKGHKADQWTKEMLDALKKGMRHVRNPPEPDLQKIPEAEEILQAEEERKRNLAKLRKKRAHGHHIDLDADGDDPFTKEPGGPLYMDSFFRKHRAKWIQSFTKLTAAAKYAAVTNSKNRKRQDSIAVLDDLELLFKEIIDQCKEYTDEQEYLLEAAECEQRIPKLPFARRGLVVNDDSEDGALQEVERFKLEQARVQEMNKVREQQLEERRQMLLKTEVGGERRGFEWLEKQGQRAERKGKPLPAPVKMLNETAPVGQASASPTAAGSGGGLLRTALGFSTAGQLSAGPSTRALSSADGGAEGKAGAATEQVEAEGPPCSGVSAGDAGGGGGGSAAGEAM